MSKWSDIYKSRICNGYLDYCKQKYKDFILELDRIDIELFIELGCGAGTFTKILLQQSSTNHDKTFFLVDNDIDMLELAKLNLKDYINSINIKFINRDLLTYSITTNVNTLIHSHSVLEHLKDDEIYSVIENFPCGNSHQVHYVPTEKYITPSYGDERLMPVYKWKQFGFKTKTFNNGYDLILKI